VDDLPAIDIDLARRLVDAQFPQWAGLPLALLDPAGSDHVIYRLGKELAIRLPRHLGAIGQARKEFEWLPRLAPCLPLAIPVPLAVGEPAFDYPWSWSVSRWLDGEVATAEGLSDSPEAAVQLGEFLTALHRFAPGEVRPQCLHQLRRRQLSGRCADHPPDHRSPPWLTAIVERGSVRPATSGAKFT
jgi:aminoglycoside phosphotransferase (APT) family kinase protein